MDQSEAIASCTGCHGFPPATGAHQAHVAGGTFAPGLTCASCHPVPSTPDHYNGQVEVVFTGTSAVGVSNPSYGSGGSCAVYCHGSSEALGSRTSPAWTSTAGIACGSCHSTTPSSGFHEVHRNPPAGFSPVPCGWCHLGYGSGTSVDLAKHVNGSFDAEPVNTTATFSSWPTSCTACHFVGIPHL